MTQTNQGWILVGQSLIQCSREFGSDPSMGYWDIGVQNLVIYPKIENIL